MTADRLPDAEGGAESDAPWATRTRLKLEKFAVPLALLWILCVSAADLVLGPKVSLLALLALAPFIAVLQPSRRANLLVGVVAVTVGVVISAVQGQLYSSQGFIRILGICLSVELAQWVTGLRNRLDQALELARHRADHDQLTGLLNRGELLARGEMLAAIREGTRPSLAVLMIDVDHFKRINDTLGHLVGDAVLAHLAERCQQALRASDLLGRFGGDEFIAILVGADPARAAEVGNRLVRLVDSEPVPTVRGPIAVTASVGVAVMRPVEALDAAIQRADNAMYEAKERGRDCLHMAGAH